MNNLNKILLGLSVITLAGCASDDFLQEADIKDREGKAVFNITAEGSPIGVITRADGEEEQPVISELKWLIADKNGKIVPHHYGCTDSQNTKLTIEGLPYGDYSLLCLATLNDGDGIRFSEPEYIDDAWLINEKEGQPVDGLYCYKKVPFTLRAEGMVSDVILEHISAMVSVDLEMPNITLWRHIKRVSVSFNEDIPAAFDACGTYSGTHSVEAYDIYDPTGAFTFTTLPSDQPVSGYVEIQSSRDNGDDIVQTYEFSDLVLEAGKIAHINLSYRHPERESGKIHIAASELWRFETDTMFLASEPREAFYDNSLRWFYADKPLQITTTDNGRLGVKFYSPIPIKNVKVRGCFNKISPEWVDLAEIEEVTPFMEAYFPLPVTDHDCTFTGDSGRKLTIPAQPKLKGEDLTVAFECDDPFMKKVATIDSHWYIRFSKFGADNGHPSWDHMTPLLCRHGVALAINMAFMFSSPEFKEELRNWDGKLYDDSKNPINIDQLITKIRNHGGLNLGKIKDGITVAGLGGGQTYGLNTSCYTGVYHDKTAVGANPHNFPREAMFHEYGHCLGYGHNSNMTYGAGWTVICAQMFVQLGREGKLPVPNSTDVTGLPM